MSTKYEEHQKYNGIKLNTVPNQSSVFRDSIVNAGAPVITVGRNLFEGDAVINSDLPYQAQEWKIDYSGFSITEPVADKLREELIRKQKKYAEINSAYTKDSPELTQIKEEKLSLLKSEIDKLKNRIKLLRLMNISGIRKMQFNKAKVLTGKALDNFNKKNAKRIANGEKPKSLPKDTTIMIGHDKKKVVLSKTFNDEYDKEKAFLMAYFQLKSGLNKTEVSFLMNQINREDMITEETMNKTNVINI